MRALPIAVLLSACWTTPPKAPAAPAATHGNEIAITDDHFGPIDAQSPGTLAAMRKLFPDFTVTPKNDPSLEYHVSAGSAELFYVVTNDDLSIFNIHAEDARVVDRTHGWRVGTPFQDGAHIDHCECWGTHPTCYERGDHVAVNFDRECDGLVDGVDRRAYKALDGLEPRAVIWTPQAFGGDDGSDEGSDASGSDASGSDASGGDPNGVEGGVEGGAIGSDTP